MAKNQITLACLIVAHVRLFFSRKNLSCACPILCAFLPYKRYSLINSLCVYQNLCVYYFLTNFPSCAFIAHCAAIRQARVVAYMHIYIKVLDDTDLLAYIHTQRDILTLYAVYFISNGVAYKQFFRRLVSKTVAYIK